MGKKNFHESFITDYFYYPSPTTTTIRHTVGVPTTKAGEVPREHAEVQILLGVQNFQQFTGRVRVWPMRRTFGIVFTDGFTDSSFEITSGNLAPTAFLKLKPIHSGYIDQYWVRDLLMSSVLTISDPHNNTHFTTLSDHSTATSLILRAKCLSCISISISTLL